MAEITFNHFQSNNVKVYPSSRRSDYYDRNSKLNSEQNLVSVINRLTGKDSFIIEGLNISNGSSSKFTLNPGSCNIHGYLFKILNAAEIPADAVEGHWAYLTAAVHKVNVTQSNATTAPKNVYEELIATDFTINESNLNAGVEIKSQLDILKVGTSEYLFNGLGVVIGEAGKSAIIGQAVSDTGVSGTAGDAGQVDVYFLPIAKRSGGKWVAITSDDSINERRWSEQSILATNIMIDAPVINGEKQTLSTANNYYDKPQDLSTWLNYNYVIDDGEIK